MIFNSNSALFLDGEKEGKLRRGQPCHSVATFQQARVTWNIRGGGLCISVGSRRAHTGHPWGSLMGLKVHQSSLIFFPLVCTMGIRDNSASSLVYVTITMK